MSDFSNTLLQKSIPSSKSGWKSFVLVCAGEMPQEPFGGLLVDEHGKASAFWAPPGVQLDRKVTLIDASLKRWRVPQILLQQKQRYTVKKRRVSPAY